MTLDTLSLSLSLSIYLSIYLSASLSLSPYFSIKQNIYGSVQEPFCCSPSKHIATHPMRSATFLYVLPMALHFGIQ